MSKSTIAMVLGDPAGIGPELIARLLSQPQVRAQAKVILIADEAEMRRGMDIAGCEFAYRKVSTLESLAFTDDTPLFYDFRGNAVGEFARRQASAVGGRYCLDTLEVALGLTRDGTTDAVLFGPLNKTSLHMAGMAHSDELHWFAERLDFHGPFCEFNVLDNLWTSRVTSHVALAEVPGLLSQARVLEAIQLIDQALKRNGLARPRIGVCRSPVWDKAEPETKALIEETATRLSDKGASVVDVAFAAAGVGDDEFAVGAAGHGGPGVIILGLFGDDGDEGGLEEGAAVHGVAEGRQQGS